MTPCAGPIRGNFPLMDDAQCAERRAFDADEWGASPNWQPPAERSVYDDDDLDDEEFVPLARSTVTPEPEWVA
jgi:hypothetical protein